MRKINGIKQRIRTCLPKPKSFKKRNFKTPEQKGVINDVKKIALEKQPKTDTCSFASEEEYGFYRLAGRIIKSIFPR